MKGHDSFLWNDHVHCFITFMEAGTVAKAAEKLRISQPAVTKQLKKFEEQLPYPVFFIEGRNKLPTSFGLELFRWLKGSHMESQKSFQNIISMYGNESDMTLRIGLPRELMVQISKYFEFKGQVQYIHLSEEEGLNALNKRDIDIAITQTMSKTNEFVKSELFSDESSLFAGEYEVIVHKDWVKDFDSNHWYTEQEFYKVVPRLTYSELSSFSELWFNRLGMDLQQMRPKVVCEDWNVLFKMVEQGKGYSIFPSDIVEKIDHLIVHKIPIDVITPLPFYAYCNPEFEQNKIFSQFIKRAHQNILKRHQ